MWCDCVWKSRLVAVVIVLIIYIPVAYYDNIWCGTRGQLCSIINPRHAFRWFLKFLIFLTGVNLIWGTAFGVMRGKCKECGGTRGGDMDGFTGGGDSLPSLPKGTYFEKGTGNYKYTAHVPVGGQMKIVHFGHRDYEHYRDSVPKSLGGKLWSHKDHNDKERRDNYRSRHRGMLNKDGKPAYKVKYTPAWFSYYYLW